MKEEPAFVQLEDEDSAAFVAGSLKRFQKKGKGKFQWNKHKFQTNTSGTNPKDRNGRVTTCANCGSRFHWAKECPNSEDKQTKKDKDSDDEVFLTCASSCARLESECYGKGNIDTACTSTVAGINWYKSFVAKLPDFFQKQNKTVAGTSFFEFGGGEKIKVLFSCRLPIMLGDLNCFLNVPVTRNPLLC